MYISTRGRYAVRAMLDIALSTDDKPVSLRAISDRQNLPISYLEQIFNRLKRVGLVNSIRGVHGGYHLGKPANEITVGSIIKVLEGPIRLSKCNEPVANRPTCIGPNDCVAKVMWERLEHQIDELLEGISLEDLVRESESLGRQGVTKKYEESVS
ncbi:MAG: Rrf2 family transcriptional regulator [candidate division Zixibacteria bacterium]|nr:Rrf2 family transcriptional regulator [candidate division Zixibacteria bacterium]